MSRDSITELLFAMRCKGTTVWVDNGCLRYRAAREPPTKEEIEELRARRTEIVALMEHTCPLSRSAEPELTRRSYTDTVPLAFSQQWLWHVFELDRSPSLRTVFSAVRLSGRLSSEFLRRSIAKLTRRHESLRTRIIVSNGTPIQHIDEPGEPSLETIDLAELSRSEREFEIRHLTDQLVNEPFFVSAGPLFSARLLKLGDYEHLLVVALDHIISDAASLGILWREIFTLYAQLSDGLPCSLPEIPIQFADYAVWQQNTHHWWMNTHSPYWIQRLAGAEHVQLFLDERLEKITPVRWATLPIQFGETLSAALRELSRRSRTTTVMSVLTAFTTSVLVLADRTDLVVPFIMAGRLRPEVENTIGFFGTPMYLRMELNKHDSYLDLLERVTTEHSTAYEHQDSCRMAMATQLPSREVMWNPVFNWIPAEFDMSYAGDIHHGGSSGSIRIDPYKLDIGTRGVKGGSDLMLCMSDTRHEISGMLHYRADMFALESVERFLSSIKSCAEMLAYEPKAQVTAASRKRKV